MTRRQPREGGAVASTRATRNNKGQAAAAEKPTSIASSSLSEERESLLGEDEEEPVVAEEKKSKTGRAKKHATGARAAGSSKGKKVGVVGGTKVSGKATAGGDSSQKRKRRKKEAAAVVGEEEEDVVVIDEELTARIFKLRKIVREENPEVADKYFDIRLVLHDQGNDPIRKISYRCHRLLLVQNSGYFRTTLDGNAKRYTLPRELDDGKAPPAMDFALEWFHQHDIEAIDEDLDKHEDEDCFHLTLLKVMTIANFLEAPGLRHYAFKEFHHQCYKTITNTKLTPKQFLKYMRDLVPALWPRGNATIRGLKLPTDKNELDQVQTSAVKIAAMRSSIMWAASEAQRAEWVGLLKAHKHFRDEFEEVVQSYAAFSFEDEEENDETGQPETDNSGGGHSNEQSN